MKLSPNLGRKREKYKAFLTTVHFLFITVCLASLKYI
jgi:hypothetical protein